MKFCNSFRAAALVLAIAMLLGLAACSGNGGSSQVQDGNSGVQIYEPSVSDPTNSVAEPLERSPLYVSMFYTVAPAALVFSDDVVLLYEFANGGADYYYLKNRYNCSYEQDGTTTILSVYGDDGELIRTSKYTFESPILRGSDWGSEHDFFYCSDNIGTKGNLVGEWIAIDNSIEIHFYSDGTYKYDDGSYVSSEIGSYELTSMFDKPAVTLFADEAWSTPETYCYEFFENDLMILHEPERSSGLVLYRSTYIGNSDVD